MNPTTRSPRRAAPWHALEETRAQLPHPAEGSTLPLRRLQARRLLLEAAARGEKGLLAKDGELQITGVQKLSTTPLLLEVLASLGLYQGARALYVAAAVAWPLALLPRAPLQEPSLPPPLEFSEERDALTTQFIASISKLPAQQAEGAPRPPRGLTLQQRVE